ncbi:hypothetical protein BDV41DRAFT_570817 [Aspergillus transmontanensis]|uniref:Aminoglycoside phosphotransferase domain-containing protein n=1 Tax=Aspergillus transmontanensis TaxID=1034304 RepID=A0A5N6WK53_9EURO|nr:hypothetical protein BDV41DRAFT_570817 [Aspergillus transmontanensis]
MDASLVSFFAKSWVNRLEEPYRSKYSLSDLQGKLDILSQELPSRFTDSIKKILEELPLIFVPTYPLVLTHTDLCEMNIIVDPDRGGITGIVDWDEAKVLPFGMSLWGFQNMLGFMNSTGWHYHENSSRLRSLFWDIFYQNVGVVSSDERRAIQIAERAGLLFRYGFTREDGVSERPANEQDSSIKYLDALLLGLDN